MKKLTTNEQRTLYKAYKEARWREAHNSLALLRTGNYSTLKSVSVLIKARDDIFAFVSVMEEKIQEEARKDMSAYPIIYPAEKEVKEYVPMGIPAQN